MLSLNNKISIRQLQALLILDVFGMGVTVVPRVVSEYAEQDGWISVIIGTFLAMLCMFFICSVAEKFPGKSFVEYSSEILTKPVAILISLLFVVKIILDLALQLRFFGEIIKQTMLYNTPFAVVCSSMILLSAFAASKGYEARARIAEILLPICFIPLIIIFLLATLEIDATNLQPFMVAAPQDLMAGGIHVLFAFSGIEFVLLAYPYLNKPEHAKKEILYAVSAIGILMIFVTLITLARFGALDVKYQMWPVIEMMDSLNLPGSLIERQDALIMSFWIISVFLIINAGLFFSSLLLKDVCSKGKHSSYILLLIPIVFVLSFFPSNMLETYQYMTLLRATFGAGFIIAVPILLLLVKFLRRI